MNGEFRVRVRALSFLFALLLIACPLSPNVRRSSAFALEGSSEESSFQLQPGSRLEIHVYREEDLSRVYEIDPSGRLSFPLVGEIQARGLNLEEFRHQLVERLKKYLVNPQVSISRSEGTIKSISILGHVTRPGTYDYIPGFTLMRLISTAEGFAEAANKRKIRIVRMAGGEKKVIMVNGVDVIEGKQDDPPIEPGDIIFVSESVF